MKCQGLLTVKKKKKKKKKKSPICHLQKNKKNIINLSSAEYVQRVVKVNVC